MNTDGIWSDRLRLGGKPCISGHRFSVAQLLAEMAEGEDTLSSIAENFDIDYDKIKLAWTNLIQELSKLKINSQYIMSDPETRGGENCIEGIPISLVLMEILEEDCTAKEEADDYYDLEQEEVEGMLWNLASLLDRDWTNGPPEDIADAIKKGPT